MAVAKRAGKGKGRAPSRRKNVAEGFIDTSGRFHPIRESKDYDKFLGGDLEPRSRKLQYEDMSLTQYVRSQGGIKYRADADLAGEMRRVRETGARGVVFEGGRMSPESMAESAREAGFRVPKNPAEFLDALEYDAGGQGTIRHPEHYNEKGWRHNGMFTQADAEKAKRVSAHDYLRGVAVRVKGAKKDATIKAVIRDRDKGVVAYVLSTGAVVDRDAVQFLNGIFSKVAGKVRAGHALKKAYRAEAALRNEIARAERAEKAAYDRAGKAEGRMERRKWERKAAAAYKQLVKAEAKLASAKQRREDAAARAMVVYANPDEKQQGRLFFVNAYVGSRLMHEGATTAKNKDEAIRKAKSAYKEIGLNPRDYKFVATPARRQNPVLETAGHVASLLSVYPQAEELLGDLKRKFKGRKKNPRPRAARARKNNPAATPATPAPGNVKKLFRTFQGREPSGNVEHMWTPANVPDDATWLGKLVEVKLVGIRKPWTFDDNPAVLIGWGGEHRQRLGIALTRPYATPAGYQAGDEIVYAEVEHVVYETSKPHIYRSHATGREDEFIHPMGEEGGRRPVFVLCHGVIELRGPADYSIRAEGIRN